MSVLRERTRIFEEMGIGPEWISRSRISKEVQEPISEGMLDVIEVQSPKSVLEHVSFVRPIEKVGVTVTFDTSRNYQNWEELHQCIQNCSLCSLGKTRTQTVLGVGDIKADWLFIGEGPGYYEDQKGEPFVGKSGELLDNMLIALDLSRGKNVYITNIVKCRATDTSKKDRPPTEEESNQCLPYLMWQIKTIMPKVIVALGKTAATSLLKQDRSVTMNALRSKVHQFKVEDQMIPVVVTYHPSYLLRTPVAKRQAWDDLNLALSIF